MVAKYNEYPLTFTIAHLEAPIKAPFPKNPFIKLKGFLFVAFCGKCLIGYLK